MCGLFCVTHQAGHSGKTVPELEKTVGMMKKVVERVQRENETLKKSSAPTSQDKVAALQKENDKLRVSNICLISDIRHIPLCASVSVLSLQLTVSTVF